MNHRHSLALVAGGATMLAALPLMTVFASFTWLFYTGIGVAAIIGTAMLVRSARGPVWAQVLAMMAALLLYLTLVFPSGSEFLRFIPTPATFVHFNALLVDAGSQIREQVAPVGDLDGLLLLTTAGVGLVAVLVDLCAVGLRRPALAGLPMLAIYSVPVAVLPEGLSVLPFGFAAAGFLWLLVADSVDRVRRFGRRFTGEGRDVDLWEPSPLSSAGRRLGVAGVVIAMIVPLAVPGLSTSLFDAFNANGSIGPGTGPGGTGASVNLMALLKDNLTRDSIFDMVRVSTTDPQPAYLRFGVADQVTPQGFVNRPPSGGVAVRGLTPPDTPAGVDAKTYHADVQVLNLDMQLAPTFLEPSKVDNLNNGWLYDADTRQIFSRVGGPNINRSRYSFDFVHFNYTPALLRTASPIQPNDTGARALATVPPIQQITDQVNRLTAGKTTEYDRVRALYDYLSPANGFIYTTQTLPGNSGNDIVDFLANKHGFCVQYAATLAWLVRAAGYPARVAFGFTHGIGISNGGYTLNNGNLHAWTEVFFPNFGWIPFDSTPAGSVPGTVQTAWAPDATKPDPGRGGDEGPDVDDPTPTGPAASVSAGPLPVDNAGGSTGGPAPVNPWWLVAAAALAAVLVMLIMPSLRRRAARRHRRTTSGRTIEIGADGSLPALEFVADPADAPLARRDAHAAWAELLDTMIDYEIPVDEAETPRATAERLSALPNLEPVAAGHSRLLARAEERARYARTPLRPDGLDAAVRGTRAALAQRATRAQRWRATFLPPSVLLRWRNAYIGGLNRMSRASARLREGLLTISPRRLLTRSR